MGVKGLMSVPEAAERLGISRSRAYGLVASGRLRSVRISAHVLVREPSVASSKARPVGRPRKKGKRTTGTRRAGKGGAR